MLKKIKTILVLTIMGCFLSGSIGVFAADSSFLMIPQEKSKVISEESEITRRSNPMLTECIVGVGIASNGLSISFDTTATQSADEIGVKDAVLQEKTWYGGWNDIPMSNYYTHNSDWYGVDIVYTAAKKGTTYRVKCTHYAKFGTTELTLKNTSSEIKYN